MAFRGHRENSRTETSKDFFALLDLGASLCIRKFFFFLNLVLYSLYFPTYIIDK